MNQTPLTFDPQGMAKLDQLQKELREWINKRCKPPFVRYEFKELQK